MNKEKIKLPEYYAHCGPGKGPSGEGRHFQRIAAFDVETEKLGGTLLAASYAIQNGPTGYLTGNSRKIRQDLFSLMCAYSECHWFAHNLQYEMRYMTEFLAEYQEFSEFFLRTNSDFFMVKIRLHEAEPDEFTDGEVLTIRDSNAIWQGDLRSLLNQFCPHLPKGEIDFEGGEIFNPRNPEHKAYSIRDSEGLLEALIQLDKTIFANFDIHFRYTTAGTALAAWQRTLRKGERYYNDKQNEPEIRKAYFGGLTFLTDTNYHEKAFSVDINSSYPYQMLTHEMPIGNAKKVNSYQKGKLGIYHVKVTVPDNIVIPIIPLRDSKGIMWARGNFETHTTNVEMEFAVTQGYSFEVISGLVWRDTAKPFKKFLETCMKIRHENPKGSAYDVTAKLLGNGLYGKFGAKRLRRQFYGKLPENPIGVDMCGNYFTQDVYQENMKCLPQWSVFITAYARMHLVGACYKIGVENVLYGDTDSITMTSKGEPERLWLDDKAYGAFKVDKIWETFRAFAPKCYAGERYIKGNLVLDGAMKGIPRKYWTQSGLLYAMLHQTELLSVPLEYKTLPRLMVLMRDSSQTMEKPAHRRLTNVANSRSWEPMPGRKVVPRRYDRFAVAPAPETRERPVDPGRTCDASQTGNGALARSSEAVSFDAACYSTARIKRVVIP